MGQPYVGEIRIFAGNFAPLNWAFCDGSLLSIANNQVLFTLIGTTYGGDGQNTFALPNLLGRVPIHQGTNISTYVMGQSGGLENVTLTTNQLPSHSHQPSANSAGISDSPGGNFWAGASGSFKPYGVDPSTAVMNTNSVLNQGSGQSHNNMIPFLAIHYIISLYGVFPTQN